VTTERQQVRFRSGPPACRCSDVSQRSMADEPDAEPLQAPTLTEFEDARARVQLSRQVALEALMASEDMPDVEALLDELVNRPAWHRQAACRGMADLFFPTRGVKLDAAREVCERCTVRSECLTAALEAGRGHCGRVGRPVRTRPAGPSPGRGVGPLPPRCLVRWEMVSVRVAWCHSVQGKRAPRTPHQDPKLT
jgi:hypothetical protein